MRDQDKKWVKNQISSVKKEINELAEKLGFYSIGGFGGTARSFIQDRYFSNVALRYKLDALTKRFDALADALGYEFENVEAHVVAKKKEKE